VEEVQVVVVLEMVMVQYRDGLHQARMGWIVFHQTGTVEAGSTFHLQLLLPSDGSSCVSVYCFHCCSCLHHHHLVVAVAAH
jgi:hypothetical protein